MNLDKNKKLIFKAIVGSTAHGMNTPESDLDHCGCFIQDNDDLISFGYEELFEVNKDEKYYEIKRFMELLMKANPNCLELLYSPDDCIVETTPQFELLRENRNIFLTKKCYDTFANYSKTQIVKAKGYDKKANWDKERTIRKDPIDFCFVTTHGKALPLLKYLNNNNIKQENCGLIKLNHFDNTYALYKDNEQKYNFKGIIGENSNELRLSSIPKEVSETQEPIILCYNKDSYSTHCKEYNAYMTWTKERNEARYRTNMNHQQKYDSKNLAHCTRLITVAKEIALENTINVRRTHDVDYLMKIKRGEVPLDEIIAKAEDDIIGLKKLYENSSLPDDVDKEKIKELLLKIRKMQIN